MIIANLISIWLLILGGINWLLAGLFKFDLINVIFGRSVVAMIIYSLFGIAAIWLVYSLISSNGVIDTMNKGNNSKTKTSSK